MNTLSHLPVSITSVDPLVKIADRQNYRIRVVRVGDSLQQEYAIAAIRCESPRYVEFLTEAVGVPLEAVKLMRNGFKLRSDASERAQVIFRALIASGIAQVNGAAAAA